VNILFRSRKSGIQQFNSASLTYWTRGSLHIHSPIWFVCGTQGLLLHLVLSQASPLAPFQLFPDVFSSHSLTLFQVVLVYPSSLYPEGSGPLRVFLMHLVVYVVDGQSNAIFFPLIIVQQVFVCSLP